MALVSRRTRLQDASTREAAAPTMLLLGLYQQHPNVCAHFARDSPAGILRRNLSLWLETTACHEISTQSQIWARALRAQHGGIAAYVVNTAACA